ncbi:MAG: SurA N-terminal domain-containing protein [Parvibaculaceae bacterium]
MLNKLRQNAGGWAARILIALLVVAFAIWGIADIFRGFSSDTVLTAGETEITAERFSAEYRRLLDDFSERLGQPISADEGRKYGIDRRVLAQLAGSAVLSEEAKELGLTVSDEMVAADIRNDETFHGVFGKFDRQTYQLALSQNQISEPVFVNDRRDFLTRDQLLSTVTAGASVPDGLAEALYEYRYERRTARYVVLPPDLVSTVEEPSEEVIAEYHQQAANRFTRPETRSFAVLTVRPSDIAPTIAVEEAVLMDEFENRRDEFDKPETRSVIQIPLADAETALRVSERLRDGEKIEEVLADVGLSIDDVTLNDVTERGFLSPDVGAAAFALDEGAVSDPVEGPLGPVVLIVTGIKPAVPAKFEDVRETLKEELVAAEAADAVFDLYNTIEDERAGGATLLEVAERFSLDVTQVDEITSQGLTAAGPPPENMPNIPDLVSLVFANDVGLEIPAGDLPDQGYFWVEVTGVTPAELKPLEEVRDDVVDLWKREKRKVLLEELAQSLVERGNQGESIEAIARSLGRTAFTSPPMLRRFSDETFSRIGVTNLFATPLDKFTYAGAGFGDSMVLMQVSDISTPEPGDGTADISDIRNNLAETAGDDLIASLVIALQEKYQVEVNYGLIDQMLSPGTGG